LVEPAAARAYLPPTAFLADNSLRPMMMHSSALAAYVQYTLAESFIPELPDRYRGKVRENYDLNEATGGIMGRNSLITGSLCCIAS
jgi:hypothetical protein